MTQDGSRKLRAAANVAKHTAKHEERKRYAAEGKIEHVRRVVAKHPCRNGMESWQSCGDSLCLPCAIRYILKN